MKNEREKEKERKRERERLEMTIEGKTRLKFHHLSLPLFPHVAVQFFTEKIFKESYFPILALR